MKIDSTKPWDYVNAVGKLVEADELYYNDPDSATLPDDEYDALYAAVKAYEDETGHIHPDSPTQKVKGGSTFAPTKHSVPMLSLEKAYEPEELTKWLGQFTEKERKQASFGVEAKYDGASLSLEYEDGKLVRAITRGDGITGDDVTRNALNIDGVEPDLGDYDGWVRGEVVIPKETFKKLNASLAITKQTPFANARNAAAGALRNSDPMEAKRRGLVFIPYDSSEEFFYIEELTNEYTIGDAGTWDLVEADVKTALADRQNWPVEADGVVVKVLNESIRERLGASDQHPKWAIAVKTMGDIYQTKLLSLTWQTGANGAVTPVAELAPVQTSKGTMQRASLHNAKFIADRNIGIGDLLDVTYAGEVIPYVVGVSEPADINEVPLTPTRCPECLTELIQEGNSQQVHCPNTWGCKPQIVGRLEKWVSRNAAKIDAIGPSWLTKFYDASLVRSPHDLYMLKREDIENLEGMGEGNIVRFLEAIEGSKNLGMRRALIGLSIPDVGDGTAKRLAKTFKSVEAVFDATDDELLAVNDIGVMTVASLRTWFTPQGQLIVAGLKEAGVNLDSEEYVDLDDFDPFELIDTSVKGKGFCITGNVPGYPNRDDFAREMEKHGAVSKSGVSKKLDFLISDDPHSNTGKMKKARDLGIPIITPEEAMDMIGIVR